MLVARRQHRPSRGVKIAGAEQMILQITPDTGQIDTAANADSVQILGRPDTRMHQQRRRTDGARREDGGSRGDYFLCFPVLADLDAAAMVAARKEKPSRLAMREDGEILPCQSRRQIGIGDALPFALDDGQGVERRSGEPRAVMFIRGLEAAFFADGDEAQGQRVRLVGNEER